MEGGGVMGIKSSVLRCALDSQGDMMCRHLDKLVGSSAESGAGDASLHSI